LDSLPLKTRKQFWHDSHFWFAIAAGPITWLLFYVSSALSPNPRWAIDEPLAYIQSILVLPIVEEIVFRGLLQEGCWRYLPARNFGPLSLANLVTSIAFVSMHFLYHPVVWAVGVTLPSLAFGYFKDQYRSVLPPIFLHVFYNFGYYTLYGAN